MTAPARIKLIDDGRGSAECPCEIVGSLGPLPGPGEPLPDAWPVVACVRCGAWLIFLHPEFVERAVEGIRTAFPGSEVSR